jgi:hypothetical protein
MLHGRGLGTAARRRRLHDDGNDDENNHIVSSKSSIRAVARKTIMAARESVLMCAD